MEIITKTIKEIIPKIKKVKTIENAEEYIKKLIKEFDFKEDICVIENRYIVTKDGKVYTVYFNKKGIRQQKARKHSNGYLRATIYGKDIYIHRLVAMCFISNPNNYKEISHEDNNKTNNNVENLKWCTRSYNNKKMFTDKIRTNEEMSRIAKMPKFKLRKIDKELLIKIREYIKEGMSDTKISKITGISRGSIYNIKKGKTYNE